MSRKLQVVTDETPAPPGEPKSITDALGMGERAVLVALRAQAARELDSGKVPAHAIAGLMRRLQDLDKDIRAFDVRAEQEAEASGADVVEDGKFDASAV